MNLKFPKAQSESANAKTLATKLTAKGENYVQQGHPWVFSDSIVKINDDAKTGDLAIIFGKRKNAMIGIGLYDADSPIRIKMIYNASKPIQINSDFFLQKINSAYQKREPLLKTNTTSYRLIFGENDGFPSLIADVYEQVLVLKLYSEIWLPYLETILESLIQVSNTETVVLRLSRSLQQSDSHHFKDGDVVYGNLKAEVVQFVEHGVNFSANVIKGHKTGYFLDHRENRRQVGELSKGKTVLDVFSYAGGFSVHALANGATDVTSVDISAQALEIALHNGSLNDYSGQHHILAGDAFKILEQLIKDHQTFDVVIIDPPSFAKQQSEIQLAKKKYAQLAALGAKLTAQNGLLVLASCSSRMSTKAFYDINEQTLKKADRPFKVEQKTQHDVDHPIGFEEGAYLKCGYYRF
ncbi:class I SAM-dependent rRNA methyltransferase [Subsaximicrobium wynnwilliamsii]|uniref:Class I SAM-dependent rRNA methyltransferase n=1 Tax=Subsaximicrobium wynnwilliamsii TaxID=291179 RepID=A0A5C6ZKD2_9FLAO|nr:class I SAM-dependent rRNA methyltransferase [Subsaximicrobium wynnwilliamsii]TXD84173.1 class I SAM-dependent rRNA methyltransferase [Subsaximicrobium wynnwilliamsii]TXD89794.1 class I SAM-dependent rRNA methyltransferase [Subsaximicrobium wynnwilliamsii]TXE03885.1 class I SAM-dependent rRNA methyltransferase [Subsaximicrobium wynnwilliamsii]